MNLKPGYKQTEVGVIPDDWHVKFLPDVSHFRCGKAHEQHISESGQFVCVNSKFISTDGRIRKYATANFCRAKKNDVLMVMSDLPNGKALAKTFLADQDDLYAVNQRICALTAYRDYCPQYLAYILNRNPYFLKFDDGVSQTHLLNNVFKECQLPLPPTLAEQEAIAEALSDADALIDSLEQLIAKKRRLKQGAMQGLLTCKRRLPGFEGEWEVLPLREGISLLSGHHVLAQFCNSDGSGYPYLTGPSDFSDGMIRHTKFTTNPATICRARDILITVKGSGVGTMAMSDGEYCISRQLMAIRVSDDWDAIFVFFSLLQDATLIGAAATGLIPGITRGDLLEKQMPIPSLPEQTAIAAILSDIDAEIAALEAKLNKARQVKQGMMQELLTGKTRLI